LKPYMAEKIEMDFSKIGGKKKSNETTS